MATQRNVYLVYYRYDDEISMAHPKWWLNWLTYKITGSVYIHVEIAFSDGDVYSIIPGKPITKTQKAYRRNIYNCQQLRANEGQLYIIKNFLDQCMQYESGFNYRGFYLLPIWPHSGAEENKWFCSELAATAMLRAGYPLPCEPCKISPGKLYEWIQQQEIGFVAVMPGSENKPFFV